jgi:hypothetical protein
MKSEAAVQTDVRLELSRRGVRVWRNNVGVLQDKDGRYIRFGLANDSRKVNENFKSSDLIGITPVTITPDMVGQTIGVFTSYEIKHEGWKFTQSGRHKAQAAWLMLVNSLGGIGRFITSVNDL